MSDQIKDLIAEFEQWITFCESLRNLDQETWNSSIEPGKWSIKSIVSHMMLWDRYFYDEAIHKIVRGEPITLVHRDFDEFNREAVEYGQRVTINSLLQDTIDYRKNIIDDIRSMSGEQVEHHYEDGEDRIFQVKQYLLDFIWHDHHHIRPLESFLKDKGML